MRTWGILAGAALLVGLAWCALDGVEPAEAASSSWDGTWFQLKVSQKGYEDEAGRWKATRERFPIYLGLGTYDAGGPAPADDAFDAEFRVEQDRGEFAAIPFRLHVLRSGSNTDDFLVYAAVDADGDVDTGNGLRVTFAGRITGKRDRDGSLTKARFKGLGGTYVERSGSEAWAGGSTVAGKAVDPSKLPFPVLR